MYKNFTSNRFYLIKNLIIYLVILSIFTFVNLTTYLIIMKYNYNTNIPCPSCEYHVTTDI